MMKSLVTLKASITSWWSCRALEKESSYQMSKFPDADPVRVWWSLKAMQARFLS